MSTLAAERLVTNPLERLWQDVRYAGRGMRKNPGVAAVTIITLALGIGANTAIFSLINTLILRTLPVRDPGRLVEFLSHYPGDPRLNHFNWKYYEHFRDQNDVFSDLTGVGHSRFEVSFEGREAETLEGGYVVGDFFPALGVEPEIGRLIGPKDDQLGSVDAAVAVVSWAYWNSRFERNPQIIGEQITVAGVPATVIGVTRREFFGLQVGAKKALWIPAAMEPMINTPSQRANGEMSLKLIGRLKPGVSLEQAQAEMRVLDRHRVEDLARTSPTRNPALRQIRLDLEPAGAGFSRLRNRYGKPLLALMAVAGLLLLITCINVASMLLARAAAREREMAVRVSLGASRLRLMRQVLTESLLLSVLGGVAGVFVAYLGADVLVATLASGRRLPGAPPIEIDVQPDVQVLLFTAAAALLTGLLFGLVPALRAMRTAPAASLRAGGKAGETRFGRLFGKSLVATQVALSVVLLSAAGLFSGHLSNLRNVGVGFERDNVLMVALDPSRSGHSGERLSVLYRELLARLEALPGVRSVSMVGATPISGAAASDFITAEGFEERQEDRRYVYRNGAGPKYFQTMGTPLLAGREFGFQDWKGLRVAIVNQALARHYFAGRDPLGKHITFEGNGQSYEIAGVVGDAKYTDLREPAPRTVYLPAFRDGRTHARNLVLRTDVAAASLAGPARQAVGDVLHDVPVAKVTTMAAQMDASIVPERLVALLSGLFGVLGAALAAIGLYGLLAYVVARRVNEIGIRMALGATAGAVTGMVLRDALGMVCAGLALGVPVAIWSKRFAAGVFENLPLDNAIPVAAGGAAMIAVALLASYVPGRRAARVDPLEALRQD